jgi:uncharacterized protein YbcI
MSEQPAATASLPAPSGLLARISTAPVQTMKQQYGTGPVSAKAYLVDDLLFVVLRGGITRAERTMVAAGREQSVRRFRQEFENEMAQPLVDIVERLTGCTVINYQSEVLFDPDLSIKIFVFDDRVEADARMPAMAASLRLVD